MPRAVHAEPMLPPTPDFPFGKGRPVVLMSAVVEEDLCLALLAAREVGGAPLDEFSKFVPARHERVLHDGAKGGNLEFCGQVLQEDAEDTERKLSATSVCSCSIRFTSFQTGGWPAWIWGFHPIAPDSRIARVRLSA